MSDISKTSANGNNNEPSPSGDKLAQPNLATRLVGSQQVPKIILVALTDLRDPDWNPRPFLDEAEMQSLVDFILSGGRARQKCSGSPPTLGWGIPPFCFARL